MIGRIPRLYIPSFVESARRFRRRRFLKGFYHIWAWRPSWSCDLDHLYKLWFPLPKEAPHKIWLGLAKWFQRRRSLKMVDGRTPTDGRRWTDGRRLDGYTISSPFEPNGSGELKIMCYKRIGYNLNVIRQSACLVINPIKVGGYAALFNCAPVYRASDSVVAPT